MVAMIRGSEGDSRFYSPNRDVAYCYVQMVTKALQHLDVEDTWAAWVGDYLRHTGTTVDDIGETAKCLADGIADFIGDLSIESPNDALEKSGFLASNPAAQLVICAKIGQMFTGMYFNAIRDVTPMGGESPIQKDMEILANEAAAVAKTLAQALIKTPLAEEPTDTTDDTAADDGV
jgi:hypothetical protein